MPTTHQTCSGSLLSRFFPLDTENVCIWPIPSVLIYSHHLSAYTSCVHCCSGVALLPSSSPVCANCPCPTHPPVLPHRFLTSSSTIRSDSQAPTPLHSYSPQVWCTGKGRDMIVPEATPPRYITPRSSMGALHCLPRQTIDCNSGLQRRNRTANSSSAGMCLCSPGALHRPEPRKH